MIDVPDGRPRLPAENDMFEPNTVFLGSRPSVPHECSSRAEAELVFAIAQAGLRGPVPLPATEAECGSVLRRLRSRLAQGNKLIEQLAADKAGSDRLQEQVAGILRHWFIHGQRS